MKIGLSIISLLVVLAIQSCQVSVKTGQDIRIENAIKEVSINNNCELNYNPLEDGNLTVSFVKDKTHDFFMGKVAMDIHEALLKEYVNIKSLTLVNSKNKKDYLKIDIDILEKTVILKEKSKNYINLLKENDQYFYNLFYDEIKDQLTYSDFQNLLEENMKDNYNEFDGFLYVKEAKNECFYFKWENKSEAIMVCLNYNLNDSIVYGLQFEK